MEPSMKSNRFFPRTARRNFIFAITAALSLPTMAWADSDSDPAGAVFVMSNQPTGNAVLAYSRDANGQLAYQATYPTGGKGAGTGADPLGSQGALVLSSGFLFAVNAGSNDVSMFKVEGTKLTLLDREPSGGQRPVSVTVKGFIAYVVNAGGTASISGYFVDGFGKRLVPLPNSLRPVAGGASAQPGQIGFAPESDELLVTEKGTQLIDTYHVDPAGYAKGPVQHASIGVTPFGFSVTRRGYAVVAAAGSGSVASYDIERNQDLTLISNVPLGQMAPCWLVTTGDGRYAYTANAGSSTISSLRVNADGTTQLINPTAAAVSTPLDLALSANSKFLYVRQGGGAVSGFSVSPDGSLNPIGAVTGLPPGAQGIAAR
ncbi:3-carboxymuconate cyclase [Paraburkholderia pallida]|uniref:3-carboxymuconate cyclase n=2 Tax=Paraburkholderia pallida TaxID=2547399 RepID=A0A4P7CUS4_9BURK|nr:3-carboxymuconate cyclase [Paraburkholderia pallida]